MLRDAFEVEHMPTRHAHRRLGLESRVRDDPFTSVGELWVAKMHDFEHIVGEMPERPVAQRALSLGDVVVVERKEEVAVGV